MRSKAASDRVRLSLKTWEEFVAKTEMESPLNRHRSETWVCVCVLCVLFVGHLQLAESYSWTQLPPDPVEVFIGSTASLTWSSHREQGETLTYVELRTGSSDIGDVNADEIVNLYGPYRTYMELKATNESVTLTINGIKKSDAGKYCCKLVTSRRRDEKCTSLKVFENFKWTQLPPNVTHKITGSVVSLRWSYDYGKDANLTSIEFRRESDGVGSSDIGNINQDDTVNVFGEYKGHVDLIAVNQSAVLTIIKLKTEDDAEYCCKLKTTKGNVEKCTRLKVRDPPTVSVSSELVVVVEGKSVTLVCNTTGIPSPSIEWTKSDEPGKVLSDTSTLTLENVQRPESADNTIKYQCSARNGIGSPTNVTVSVVVYYKPRNTTLFTSAATDTVTADRSVTFNCTTDANPPADVFNLYHEGSLITQNAIFTIERVSRSNQGKYTCVPSNIIGEGQSASVALTVLAPPAKVSTADMILKPWLIILLAVLGGIVFLVLLPIIIYCCCLKRRKERKSENLRLGPASEALVGTWDKLPESNPPTVNMYGYQDQDQGMTDVEKTNNDRLLPLETSFKIAEKE